MALPSSSAREPNEPAKVNGKVVFLLSWRALHSIEPPRNVRVYLKSIQSYHTSTNENDLNGIIDFYNDVI